MNAGSNFEFSRPQTSVLTTAADRTLHMAGQRGGKTALMGPLAYSFVSYLPSVGPIAIPVPYSTIQPCRSRVFQFTTALLPIINLTAVSVAI